MRVSVFTPTHDPKYLGECWKCLREQEHKDWEWVVVCNGTDSVGVAEAVRRLVNGDRRVVVFTAPDAMAGNIGALKRLACEQSRGELLAEYDHDDLLTPDCLSTVVAVAKNAAPNCFIFSDDLTCGFDWSPRPFMASYGWRHYDWKYEGRTHRINAQPTINPRSLCEILYAPDHIRVWSRSAYMTAGKHNPIFNVGDDHELIVRTYLAGAEFAHIARPLYIHRIDDSTTSQQKLDEIGRISRGTRDKHLYGLVEEWCRRRKLPMLDLGGAHGCPDGYTPVDLALPRTDPAMYCANMVIGAGKFPPAIGGDVFDVLENLPPSSVGGIRAFDFLEHIPAGRVPALMNLLYKVLVPGGFLLSQTPAVCDNEGRCGRGAYQDPTHVSFWSSNNTWYYTDRDYAKYLNGAVDCRFQSVVLANHYPSEFHRTHLIPYLRWDAMSLKNDDTLYFPGPRKI